jgi:glyoxylase-like metal-dependent hydrolase (beta-lactamase superfamily II)
MQITKNIHRIGGFVNQYLLIDNDELTLIDAGMPPNAGQIIKYIKNAGLNPDNLKRILITHSDPDHYGAAKKIKEMTGAEIWTSQIEADAMKIGSSSRDITPKGFFALIFPLLEKYLSVPPTNVDKIIQAGDILAIHNGLQVISSPGHTPGHISLFLPDERILFAGDAIRAKKGSPIATTDATTGDPVQAQATFENLMKFNPLVIACGHAYIDNRK